MLQIKNAIIWHKTIPLSLNSAITPIAENKLITIVNTTDAPISLKYTLFIYITPQFVFLQYSM